MKRKGQAEMVDSSFLEDAACSAKSKKFSPFPESKDAVLKPVKLTQRELYKPPTTEEVNRLQETENLFHSSLLRMQIEELLKEVILSEEKRKKIDLFVQEVTTLLSSVPETNFTEIADQSWLPPGIKVPLLQIPFTVKGRFRMAPPCSLNVVGSYPLGTCTKPDINVDLAVTMPPEILQEKDYLNQRFHRKRALYLCGLAHHLLCRPVISSMHFTFLHGDYIRPILLVRSADKDLHSVTLRLYVCIPADFFKPSRFHICRNNIRSAWFQGWENATQEISEPPTPHYNNGILREALIEAHLTFLNAALADFPGCKEGIMLLKIWLRQRKLDQGFGGFTGFHVSMLVAYLISRNQISPVMSSYQVLRSVLHFLAITDLTVNGITLATNPNSLGPTLSEFHSAFQVVFIDPSGFVNVFAAMTTSRYKQVQHEAQLSMQVWDNPNFDGFHALFMTTKTLVRSFDHVFHISCMSRLQRACNKMKLLSEMMDHNGNYVAAALPYILSILQRGLGERIRLLIPVLPQTPEWSIDTDPPQHKDMGLLSFGMLLNTEHSTNILEKGPAADSVQATEFRRFWGNKAELRRFQDGSLCEAVIWHGDSLFEKRLITEKIVKHLLQLHADIPESSVNYVGGLLDRILQVGRKLCRTGEEESMKITHAFDDLNRKLWNLEGLPLTITSVQAAHSSLRHTQVFPPLPMNLDLSFFQKEKLDNSLLPLEEKPCPAYIPAFQVICHMEGSGKWPQKKEAIRRIKAAFHIRLAELLRQQYGLICRPAVNALDVYKDGFVFRVQVAYHRESHFLKEGLTSDGMVHYCNAKEALKLELETVHMPLLTNVLNGLQQQHSTFGTTARLAKRWIGAHLLDACLMSDEAVELLVASLFLHPAPFNTPNSPQVGFIRFLLLLSSFDWKNNPLIVNFNGEFSDAEYTEIKNYFVSTRSNLPAMFIATPQDKKNSVWTRESPSVQILQRLIMLASESILVLERQLSTPCSFQDMKVVFRSPLNIYDVLIHLNPKRVPRQAQAIDMPTVTFSRGALFSEAAGTKAFMPIVEFDPVSIYLKELRDAFGELALFFCDPNGGLIIAVLWKPQAFSKQTFRASHMNARLVEIGSNGAQTVPNVEAILEDFEILGAGLVEKLEIQTEKWSI